MANGWTPERRAKQAEAIKRWKPWEQSTGPKSREGEAVSSQNGLTHGMRSREWLEKQHEVAALLRACRDRLKKV
ncbi:hypothetical protein SAMN06265784_102453 [Paraburkholderia susongensis]|uniref:Uncharacterized protein n=1 Tax=Paraburkholderia susongensis TaxID=1515439 RepID=A0A1X7JDH1_9BURK|nr:hypothetical protein SAMN06265784_102453 [Paraburkholderia susongensis]